MNRDIRAAIEREEFDYQTLMAVLAGYSNPRAKVTSLLRDGVIVRVKKGLYVFGDSLRRRPFSRELLANLIYGPSFVSEQFALSYHGLIPERVGTVTSVTTGRARTFETPVGVFEYRRVPVGYFPCGMARVEEEDVAFLVAVPERALADVVRGERGNPLRSNSDMEEFLFEGLRIEPSSFLQMDPAMLRQLSDLGRSRKLLVCARLLERMKGGR